MAVQLPRYSLTARRFLVVAALSLSFIVPSLLGAQDSAAKPRAKPRGRLPAYYAKVVTPQQKEQVYSIQAQYEPKIDALEAQIVALERERDEAIRGLLSATQRTQIDELTAAAEAKRAERKANEDAGDRTAVDMAPAAKSGARPAAKAK
jgi:hypothetical protein